jgi:hypothetical protein
MLNHDDQQLYDRLKAEPESALGLMECTIEILVSQLGAALTKKLALRAWNKSRRREVSKSQK